MALEITITKNEDGIRLNKFIKKVFPTMPDSLIYKLLRKKYFEINKKKACGNELLKDHDKLSIFLGKDTIEKYSRLVGVDSHAKVGVDPRSTSKELIKNIIFEDDNIIIFNKPVGMLSQGVGKDDKSVNSILCDYVNNKKDKTKTNQKLVLSFKPSIVNRLDRNTSGLIIFAKTYIAAKEISKMIKEERVEKHYKTLVNGIVKKDKDELVNYYKKDEKTNKAEIFDIPKNKISSIDDNTEEKIVRLKYEVIKRNKNTTLLDINLITGKSHQIRAQLSHIGHPIICDKKYMDAKTYDENVKEFGKKSQDLCCYKIKFDEFSSDILKKLSHKEFKI